MMGAVVPEVVLPERLGVREGTVGTLLPLNGDFRSSGGNVHGSGALVGELGELQPGSLGRGAPQDV